jgi:hypothetical protein
MVYTNCASVKKIKEKLIHKAKLKQQYAKLKLRQEDDTAPRKSVYDREAEAEASDNVDDDKADELESKPEPTLEPHPDRVSHQSQVTRLRQSEDNGDHGLSPS